MTPFSQTGDSVANTALTLTQAAAADGQENYVEGIELDSARASAVFRVGLSPSGNAPATHYWCSWHMTPGDDGNLRTRLDAARQSGRVTIFDGRSKDPEEVLVELGLKRVTTPA